MQILHQAFLVPTTDGTNLDLPIALRKGRRFAVTDH